ncbi:uncharacterized protein LOC118483324 isoform X1 [Helianthus annuus]|uniref:uncharacterized protein LOC118483324 isoform X1 n=1 Tax=Helianthus annuus TaxID=4232 RepID=UPI00165322E3|nr:uncharacterized protein LOC118483324 isoform X1 [Helianthus annuus]
MHGLKMGTYHGSLSTKGLSKTQLGGVIFGANKTKVSKCICKKLFDELRYDHVKSVYLLLQSHQYAPPFNGSKMCVETLMTSHEWYPLYFKWLRRKRELEVIISTWVMCNL